jgi:hypothetical protein
LNGSEVASANGGGFEFLGDRDNGNGKVAAVEQTEEGEEAYCEIGCVLLRIGPILEQEVQYVLDKMYVCTTMFR